MGRFDSGISGYVIGEYTVRVYFPIDSKGEPDISCKQCPYYRISSRTCALNGKIVAFPEKFVGQKCPLECKKEGDLDGGS